VKTFGLPKHGEFEATLRRNRGLAFNNANYAYRMRVAISNQCRKQHRINPLQAAGSEFLTAIEPDRRVIVALFFASCRVIFRVRMPAPRLIENHPAAYRVLSSSKHPLTEISEPADRRSAVSSSSAHLRACQVFLAQSFPPRALCNSDRHTSRPALRAKISLASFRGPTHRGILLITVAAHCERIVLGCPQTKLQRQVRQKIGTGKH
jgi:hypothetical protein